MRPYGRGGRDACAPSGFLLALVVVALIGIPGSVHAQGEGRIDGQLINGTRGAGPPSGVTVTVHVLRDRAKIGEQLVQTDDGGGFHLEGLSTGPGAVYFPIVEYGGAAYFPERPIVLDQAPEQRVEIRVFEPTNLDDAIAFDRANMLITAVNPGALTVLEMGAVVNGADRTYVGTAAGDGPPATLRFALPRGASEVTPQAGLPPAALVGTADGFFSTNPILPGRHELALSYQVPFEGSTLDIAKRLEYPTAAFNLYVPATAVSVVSPQLTAAGTSEMGGQRYQVYGAQGLPGGSQIALRFSGLPASAGARAQQLGFAVLGFGVVGLGGAALFALRRRSAEPTLEAVAAAREAGSPRLELLRALAELDERFTAGEVDEQRYRVERQEGKARLVAMLKGAPPAR